MPGKKLGDLLKENLSEQQLKEYFQSLLEEELLISVFNNKGGVGKSSSCAELAIILAQNGMKVLVVDADSQGSVSSRILHRNFIDIGRRHNPEEEEEQILADLGEDYVRAHQDPNDPQDLIDIQAFFTSVNSRPANPQELSRSVNRVKLFKAAMNKTPESEEGGVWVMLGALDLENVETMISNSLTLGAQVNPASVSIPGALPMALRCLARDRDFDAVFIDLNPAPTALNQCLLLGSNHYEVPYTADFSSLRAVKNLNEIIPRWNRVIDTKNLRASGLGKGVLHPVGCFPQQPTLLAAICHRIPAKMPNAYQRARASIMQQLLRLSEQSQSVVSYVVSEGYSTAVAAGLDGTALSDITKDAARRIHQSKEGKTIAAKKHIQTGNKISGEYLFALTGMIAAMSDVHRARLHEEQFKSNLEENKNQGLPPQSQNAGKKRKQPEATVGGEILTSPDNTLRYRVERVAGNGDCGLSAFNIEREDFCQVLRNLFFEDNTQILRAGARQSSILILREMFELFSDQNELAHFPEPVRQEWERVSSRLHNKRQDVGKARALWIANLPENLRARAQTVQKEEQFYNDPQLAAIAGSAQHQEIRALLLAWTQCMQQESQTRVELQQFLCSPVALDAFINYITEDGRWVGVQTLLLYARNTHTSLVIHRTDARGNVSAAVPAEQYLAVPVGQIRHIVYNGRDHFDRLIELPPVANANVASAAPVVHNPNNPMVRRSSQVVANDDKVVKKFKK
jgi:cellulose biosynthesis protein BcsQ